MLSLETARKLKETGLRWEPQIGDWFYYLYPYHSNYTLRIFTAHTCTITQKEFEKLLNDIKENGIWCPRLEQLLAEITKRLPKEAIIGLEYPNWQEEKKWEIVGIGMDSKFPSHEHIFADDTPDEAAAQALLWILKVEKRNGK